MAQYYNFLTNTGTTGTLTFEDVQRLCSVDGQSVQLVVEDVNTGGGGGGNVSQQFLTYTAAATTTGPVLQNREQAIFSHQINLASPITGTHLEQGQSVYIIKTNDIIHATNVLRSNTTNTQPVTNNVIDIVDNKGIKSPVGCNNARIPAPWTKMEDTNLCIESTLKKTTIATEKNQISTLNKTQLPNNTGLSANLLGRSGSSPYTPLLIEKKSSKLQQVRPRNPLGGITSPNVPPLTSLDRSNTPMDTSLNRVQNANVSSNNKNKIPVGVVPPNVTTRNPRQFLESISSSRILPQTPVSQTQKPPIRLQKPELEFLSERIKNQKLKQAQLQQQQLQKQPQQQLQKQQLQKQQLLQRQQLQRQQQQQQLLQKQQLNDQQRSLMTGGVQRQTQTVSPSQHAATQNSLNNPAQRRCATPKDLVQQQKLTTQRQKMISPLSPDTQEPMDVDCSESSSPEKMTNRKNTSDSDADSNVNESYAYLQETIDDPATTIVQRQIKGNTAKMLVMLMNGEQRLITFDLPAEECTVQDLLEQVEIQFCPTINVSLVSDPALGINYIVEAGGGSSSQENNDSTDSNLLQENVNSHNNPTRNQIYQDENSNSSMSMNEEPLCYEGKLAVCPNCGISSNDFNQCERCKKKIPKDAKIITCPKQKKENMPSVDSTTKKANIERTPSSKLEKLDRDNGSTSKRAKLRRPGVNKSRLVPREPECLTISSDEEEENKHKRNENVNNNTVFNTPCNPFNEEMDTIIDKEPIITNTSIFRDSDDEDDQETCRDGSNATIDDDTTALRTTILCRTVRIGSYKYFPREEVLITQHGLRFSVPLLEDAKNYVMMDVRYRDIVRVLIHFGKTMPVIFFYINIRAGATIRELLGMQDPKGPYYDPAGRDNTHKRITLLPEELSDESKVALKSIFSVKDKLMELSGKEANDILVRASPKDSVNSHNLRRSNVTATPGNNSNVNGPIQTITVYPPPPAKGGIAINTEDYLCLGEDQFLNDVIIDFYLKYLTLEILSQTDQSRTHVFSSYFYKRLTSPHASAAESTVPLSPAAKRHARVQKWTKNVNLFEKDFIIIPINEHAHWFLAIICYPGLVGRVPLKPLKETKQDDVHKIAQKSKKLKDLKLQAVTIGSTTITPVTTTITLDQPDDGSERDEAEGDEEEMEMDSDEDDENEETTESEEPPGTIKNQIVPGKNIVKVPSILIFDSLAGASRARVVATLRDYLSCEHVAKMGVEKTFSKDTIRGASPKVPQQSNFTDCGLYVLQYVESFFKNPIQDYTYPIKVLRNWFEEIIVTRKREEVSQLLIKLMNVTRGDKIINLPAVNFPTENGKLKPKSENNGESKTTKSDIESKKKSPTTELESRSNSSTDNSTDGVTRSTYNIIPNSGSSSTDTNSETSTESKTYSRSSSETMSYLKSKRIPRLVSKMGNQDDQQVAKKLKGE